MDVYNNTALSAGDIIIIILYYFLEFSFIFPRLFWCRPQVF